MMTLIIGLIFVLIALRSSIAMRSGKLDRKVNVTSATLAKTPYRCQVLAREFREQYPTGLPCSVFF